MNAKITIKYIIHYTEFDFANLSQAKQLPFETTVNLNNRALHTGRQRAIKHANSQGIAMYRIFDIEMVSHD